MNKHFCFFVSYGLAGCMGTFHICVTIGIAEVNTPEDVDLLVNEVAVNTGKQHEDVGLINWKRLPGGDIAHGSQTK